MRIAAIGLGMLVVALGSGAAFAAGGAGGGAPAGGGSFSMPERQMTPEDQAKAAYNQGVRAVKAADKLAKTADEATDDKKKAKAEDKAKRQYENARGYFASALQRKADMYEAWNYVGYTSRKLGDYDKALQSYDEALRIFPTYGEAIEYRGEAYLGLNRIEDAKGAYMQLFQSKRPLADQLMAAMQKWVAQRRAAGNAAAEVDALAQWIDERSNIARQTASLATDAPAVVHWN
jgi:tetratricopeptide (TPR) repeat protein